MVRWNQVDSKFQDPPNSNLPLWDKNITEIEKSMRCAEKWGREGLSFTLGPQRRRRARREMACWGESGRDERKERKMRRRRRGSCRGRDSEFCFLKPWLGNPRPPSIGSFEKLRRAAIADKGERRRKPWHSNVHLYILARPTREGFASEGCSWKKL